VRILRNKRRIAEYAKSIGISKSRGEYFILIDADNEIVENDWLRSMVRPMLEQKNIFGVESPLSHDASLSSLNRYFARMRIADPLAKYLATVPEKIDTYDGYDVLVYGSQAALITGANGFLWHKAMVLEFEDFWKDKFEEANFATYIHEKTGANYAVPHGASIRHFYCDSLADFVAKRKKIAGKMKKRIHNHEYTWVSKKSNMQIVMSAAYLVSIVGPVIESVIQNIRQKTMDYVWHPISSFITIMVYLRTI
jgi:glycosyltransferase involved in cell wall biosynthesis